MTETTNILPVGQRAVFKSGDIQYRTIELDRATVKEDDRTVELAFSSEAPVERYFGTEILDHKPESVNLSRLNSAAPLLLNHDRDEQIGVVELARIDGDRKGRAMVRFGKGIKANEIFQDVKDGIRRLVSVGYRIHKMVTDKVEEGKETLRATSWEPLEVSIVSIPADTSVGVGRGEQTEIIERKDSNMSEKIETPPKTEPELPKVNRVEVLEEGRKAERLRVTEIDTLAEQFKGRNHQILDEARKAKQDGAAVADFKERIWQHLADAKPVVTQTANIGMNGAEVKRWSIVKAIRDIVDNGRLDGLEKEASDATAKVARRDAKGFFIPQDIMESKRVMSAGVSTAGGYTIATDLQTGSMIELLRNKTLVSQIGARTLSGLVGNVAIPKVTGGATAYWLSESGTVTASNQTFGQLALVPHRLVGDTAYTKELLNQSSIDVEGFIREDIMRVLAIAKDLAAIAGTGASGQPVGVINTTSVGAVTYGAAATWAKVVESETTLAVANADAGSVGWLTTPAVRGKWKTAVKESGQAVYLWENGGANGYSAGVTNQVPSDKTIFGNWSDLILAEWAGIDVVVDPYSLKKQGQIEITVTLWTDNGVRHPASFVVSADSAAQ